MRKREEIVNMLISSVLIVWGQLVLSKERIED